MLEFGEKLTIAPSAVSEQDIVTLRSHGFGDREIVSIVLASAYRNYIIRVADGLGVELTPGVDYAPELIRAFGVDPQQAHATLYADRIARPAASDDLAAPAHRPPDQKTADRVCWVDLSPAAGTGEQFERAVSELVRISGPVPLDHLGRALALRPDALAAMAEYLRLVDFGGSGLGPRLEALIGLVVAAALWTPYPGVHHAERLLATGATPEEVAGIVDDPDSAGADQREREVARFCARLTRAPDSMTQSDVEALRSAGFDDREIITIVASAALQTFLCRVAAGLGVSLEAQRFSGAIASWGG